MSVEKPPTQFSFDFSRADRVVWSYGARNGRLEGRGTPAGFFVNDNEIADQFAQVLQPLMADLVDIAIAAHVADRLARRTVEWSNNWSRQLQVKICVRHPEAWTDAHLKEPLEKLLTFLTEDVWRLDFVPRRDGKRSSEIQTHLFPQHRHSSMEVSLFSGGLDSFAGTAAALAAKSATDFILLSASPNTRQRLLQQQQVKVLNQESGQRIRHVCVPYGMYRGEQCAQEPSRRTRGFLFLVLGGVTALSAGSSALYLYENGLGAINLPYDRSQIGADNSRAVHPRMLRETGELLSLVGSKQFSIVNRCIFQTKAEMLGHPTIDRVSGGIPLTFSCDGFPVRAKGRAQCGFCTSCVLRRFSLETARLSVRDEDGYLNDWRSESFKPSKHHLRGLRAMDWQALRLNECFELQDPWYALTCEFPELRVLVNDLCLCQRDSPGQLKTKLLRLLKQHTMEWQSFSALRLLGATN